MRQLAFKAVGRGASKWLPDIGEATTIPQGPSGALHDFADHWLLGFPFTVPGEWCTLGAMLYRQAWMLDYGEAAAIDYIAETARNAVLPQFLRRGIVDAFPVVETPDPLCMRLGLAVHWACGGCLSVQAFTAFASLGWTQAAALWGGDRHHAANVMDDAFSELLCVVSGDAVLTWDEPGKRILVTSLIPL